MLTIAANPRPAFLLPFRVLSKLFRRLFLTRLLELHAAGRLQFFGEHLGLGGQRAFLRYPTPARRKSWVVYAKPPFAGPEDVIAHLSRYTHRVAIANRRLISLDETGVTFRYKDYRREGADRQRTMTLTAAIAARNAGRPCWRSRCGLSRNCVLYASGLFARRGAIGH